MKALVYTAPETLDYRDEPDVPDTEDIIVTVEACGICGSDMHAYLGHDDRRPAPLILGHEVAGIAQSGKFSGQRVAINPLVTCMECPACIEGRTNLCPSRQIISMMPRPGGFAEYVCIPERNLLPVPDGLAPAIASLTEPIAVSYHAINLAEEALHRSPSASSAVVIGGGAIGVAAAAVLKSRGVHRLRVAETNPLRIAALETSGQYEVFDPAAEPNIDNTADLVVDAVGYEPTRALACRIASPGGVIVHVGLGSATGGVDVRKLTLQEITFIGAYTYTMTDFAETLAGLAAGRFGKIDWTEERSLADGATAFLELRSGTVPSAKIILCP